ncbi:GNAT family N-acetyltransferase [Spirosoma luteum]|uniref:GNAT family N-acetyltransferase n=1 Tax=Spirosoma luteum TaxID=431553 RepID=UPI000375536B|nr:GNAT family N-acetyltransferase [Spirosoma luteum]
MTIRTARPEDWPALVLIYQQGIDTGQATFETQAPPPDEMAIKYLPAPQLVAEQNGAVIGYALLSAVSGRCVYGGVAEVSVYVGATARGQGIGGQLLDRLITDSETLGFWTLQAGIFTENTASVALHHRHGFRTIGYREKLGQHNGVWRDVLLLERRSLVVG